jgi:hypothetical protein
MGRKWSISMQAYSKDLRYTSSEFKKAGKISDGMAENFVEKT